MTATERQERKERRRQRLQNISPVLGSSLYITLGLIKLVLGAILLLLIAEWIFPKYVHIFNYSLSDRTFEELKAAHRYQAAANFFEQKQEVLTNNSKSYQYLYDAADCYKRIGEYGKAENLLKDIYHFKAYSEQELEELNRNPGLKDFSRFVMARELVKLYESMGDYENMKLHYGIMKSHLSPDARQIYTEIQEAIDPQSNISISEFTRLYDLKFLYLEKPDSAISEMDAYIDTLLKQKDRKPAFILSNLNQLSQWVIEQQGPLAAYPHISFSVTYADQTDAREEDKSGYGTLADLCFQVHDIKNSKRFYDIYTAYLSRTTSSEDPLYIENLVRGFKFLEAEKDWDHLRKQVTECCIRLKKLLGKNLFLMSESQREYFVELLDAPFDYALNLLAKAPSEELARLCLDNSLFMKGLLLRSNREVSNLIRNSGDQSLVEKYEELQEYRKELSYRENIDNIGNALAKNRLKRKINELDKELATASEAYRKDKESAQISTDDISRRLDTKTVAIEFTQTTEGQLIAIIVNHQDKIISVNLGNSQPVAELLQKDFRTAYARAELSGILWQPLETHLNNISNIFYSTSGIFNTIAIPALNIAPHRHLIDQYRFHLLSNMANLVAYSQVEPQENENRQIAIWGHIDYGCKTPANTLAPQVLNRDIERGDPLYPLVFSRDEVLSIRTLAQQNHQEALLYVGDKATEASFKARSGKGDNILHISTHGFFEEDDAHRKDYNPMYNSGLFFAGADSCWNRHESAFTKTSMLDDGILRADEIQYLDFSDCSMAVLSACKTGLGQERNSEGVYGLQRAFKLAGADKILMSLWNVDDKCTAELMTEFYRQYYAGNSDEEALRKAQESIRERYPSPEYWGAFVLLY